MRRVIYLLISILVSVMGAEAIGGDLGDALRGKKVYSKNCAACHGYKGNGRSPAAQALRPKPADFTQGVFKFRSTPSGQVPTDEDLFRSISEGIPWTRMPAWKDLLTDEEIWDVVAYLKTFSSKFQLGVPRPLVIPPEPPVTEGTTARGKETYQKAGCFQCHGVEGRGDGPLAKGLRDHWGDRIRPFDFTKGIYKGGPTNEDLYRTLVTGIDGTPMPSYQALGPPEVWSLVHYLRSLSKKKESSRSPGSGRSQHSTMNL